MLILTPAGLVWQWFRELKEKFNLSCGMQRSEYDWERTDLLIASHRHRQAKPHREIIHRLHYDILVVDEAHKLKNAIDSKLPVRQLHPAQYLPHADGDAGAKRSQGAVQPDQPRPARATGHLPPV